MKSNFDRILSSEDVTLDSFTPLGDWVLVRPFMRGEPVGIILPEGIT